MAKAAAHWSWRGHCTQQFLSAPPPPPSHEWTSSDLASRNPHGIIPSLAEHSASSLANPGGSREGGSAPPLPLEGFTNKGAAPSPESVSWICSFPMVGLPSSVWTSLCSSVLPCQMRLLTVVMRVTGDCGAVGSHK